MDIRSIYIILVLLLSVIIVWIAVLAFENSSYRTKSFEETVDIGIDEVTKITISSPIHKGKYNTTNDQDQIKVLLNYLKQFEYQRLSGDQASYMPMKANIIYLYVGEESVFIVPYETGAMISYKVYRIRKGVINKQFLIDFYDSLEREEYHRW